MKSIRGVLVLISLLSVLIVKAQFNSNIEDLKMYHVQIDGILDDEQGLFIARLITECEAVLIASVNISGFTRIVSEGELNFNPIFFKLQGTPNISIKDRYETAFNKEEYISVYNEFRRVPLKNLSDRPPVPIVMPDKEKQEKAYSVAKKIWIEMNPEAYDNLIPKNVELSPEEKEERAVKMSNLNRN